MHAPIAYTYEADYHCPDCTEDRFGRTDDGFIAGQNDDGTEATDGEGNPVGAIFSWEASEWADTGMHCGDCLTEIVEADDDDYDEAD